MMRSFTDRVFGGVCGGLGAGLRLNPWLLRAGVALLSVASLGAAAVAYLWLWWTLPQQSHIAGAGRGLGGVVWVILAIALAGGLWAARQAGLLRAPDGGDLYLPALLLLLAAGYFVRQVRAV
jgi:phage shock protein PspC (stress-responsive transcriptional regulator)